MFRSSARDWAGLRGRAASSCAADYVQVSAQAGEPRAGKALLDALAELRYGSQDAVRVERQRGGLGLPGRGSGWRHRRIFHEAAERRERHRETVFLPSVERLHMIATMVGPASGRKFSHAPQRALFYEKPE